MSEITIKPLETAAETEGKAYVHWKSWQEAYAGIIDPGYLSAMTLEKCRETARRWPARLLVAKDGGRVVGFTGCGPYRDGTLPDTGEVFALYILQEYCGAGLGRKLMDAALENWKDMAAPPFGCWRTTGGPSDSTKNAASAPTVRGRF